MKAEPQASGLLFCVGLRLSAPWLYSGSKKIERVECRPAFGCTVPELVEGQGKLRALTIDVRSIVLLFAIKRRQS
jgi:hypothetical protein